jgi:UDP-glucose 4-epimerase
MPRNFSKIVVTGGAGFIGSHIVDRILKEGYETVVIDDLSQGRLENISQHLENEKFKFLKADIRDLEKVEPIIKDADAIFHEAAVISVSRSLEDPAYTNDVNVAGTLNLLKASLNSNIKKFIYASSCAVYGEAESPRQSEENPTSPRSPYAVTKIAAENYCKLFNRLYGLEAIILRYFNVYGPRQSYGPYSGVITKFIDRLIRGEPPVTYGDGEQTRDFVDVSDIVEANMLTLQRTSVPSDPINIGTGTATSIKDLANLLIDITGRKHLKPAFDQPRTGDIKHSCADIGKARRVLGYEPKVPLREGLVKLLDIYEEASTKSQLSA